MTAATAARWPVTPFMLLGYGAIVALVFGLGTWSMVTRISGAVVVAGSLEVQGNRQVVQHPTGGVIAAINARDGEEVSAGDVLIRLDGESLYSELGIVEGQWFEILARKSRLGAERDGLDEITFDPELTSRAATSPQIAGLIAAQQQQFDARAKMQKEEDDQLRERQVQISNQIDGMLAVRAATKTQIDLLTREISGQQTLLDQGLTQLTKVLTPQRELAGLEGTAGQTEASIAENRGKIAEIAVERISLESKTREEAISDLRDLEYREIELREKRTSLKDQIDKLDLRAPASGIVYGNTADTLRGVIRPAEPIMYIVPKESPLIVRGRVMPNNIDQVHAGQTATLRFTAFDARTTPELKGEVTSVSADAIEDKQHGTRYYTADVQIEPGGREKLGGRKLLPGMPVELFIGTEARSPLSYFLKPFTDYFARAFQEG